jgi:peptide/nickel transport system permease protein
MTGYIVNRLLLMVPTLLGVAIITFLVMRVVPGDIVELRYTGQGGVAPPEEQLRAERERLGLNKPLAAQFLDWVWGVARLDFGVSMWTGRPIAQEIAIRLELSLQLAVMATLIATALAVPLGVISAVKQNTWIDYVVRVVSIAGLAMPSFWIGIVMVLLLLVFFRWSPPISFTPLLQGPAENLSLLIWPALAVGYRYSAVATRMTRSALLEVLREDYVRTARAKGLADRVVVLRHALRNALLPVVTVISLEFAFLIGGLVVTEQVFNLNGIGKLLVEAVARRDYTMTQALVMLTAGVFIVVNFVVDLLYVILDPRIRYS